MNFLKGIVVGIANIVPGLSGSALLFAFNLYEKCIEAICNILKNFKKSISFLFPIGFGILLGSFIFSNIITFFITNYPLATSIVFIGFIIGTLPSIFNQAIKKGYSSNYYIAFFITFVLGIILLFFKSNTTILTIDINLINYLKLFLLGIIVAFSTIVPGISCTVLLSIIGMYGIYINAIGSFNLIILFPILIGFIIGGFFISKIINYLLKKYYGYTFFAIIGFVVATIPGLIKTRIILNLEFFIGIAIAILAFFITNYSLSKIKNN